MRIMNLVKTDLSPQSLPSLGLLGPHLWSVDHLPSSLLTWFPGRWSLILKYLVHPFLTIECEDYVSAHTRPFIPQKVMLLGSIESVWSELCKT
ncbi:hypothetical protein TNIN_490221 [Trichonephila inaurata madagascariensis]|uniref:Uncharacterized protein n=1 Tax=Trichonephila inaurata madagascariensis TaxID=2747483 RepID=A0A8X6JPG4_9ARAC|nr:hypothetical protein TNIN_490221 [Trichonephila inaurata madagascariensis]